MKKLPEDERLRRKRASDKRYYETHREERRIQCRDWYRAHREVEMVRRTRRHAGCRGHADAIKLERGCIDCGYRDYAIALDFDHHDGTKSRLVGHCHSKAAIDAEVAKCDVRCANCHRVRHLDRRKLVTAA